MSEQPFMADGPTPTLAEAKEWLDRLAAGNYIAEARVLQDYIAEVEGKLSKTKENPWR